MGAMVQKQENLGELEQVVERCLEKRLGEFQSAIQKQAFPPPRDSGLERELRHQRELMQEGFKQMDKRFEAMDKRFEAMDKRFEEMRSDMNKRFEAVDKRFEMMDKRFEEMRSDSNARFEMLIASTDKRFEAVDKRFEELRSDMNTRFTFMQWMILSGFGLLAFLMSFYKFFP